MVELEDAKPQMTAEEAEIYDRQIRLWGIEAQNRLRNSSVLLAGMGGMSAEVAKNLVLAGIKEITLQDEIKVKEADQSCQFLLGTSSVGQNVGSHFRDASASAEAVLMRLCQSTDLRATASQDSCQGLNPMVKVKVEERPLTDLATDYFDSFDVIIVIGKDREQTIKMNELSRSKQKKFYCGSVWGTCGYFFSDLAKHEFVEEVEGTGECVDLDEPEGSGEPQTKKAKGAVEEIPETVMVKRVVKYSSLAEAMGTDWSEASKKRKFRWLPKSMFKVPILYKFRSKNGRDPERGSESDEAELRELSHAFAKKNGIDLNLENDFEKHCYGEWNPVCAIVGGVLAQDVIKAISQKDAPLDNFFIYDSRVPGSCGITVKLPFS